MSQIEDQAEFISGTSSPLVSVVIPTHNSSKTVSRCLESINGQSYPYTQIIVVDRFSNDGTIESASKFGAEIILSNSERTHAKNLGLSKSKGKYVLFLDSDMALTSKVLEECIEESKKPNLGGIIVPERSVGNSFWVRVRDFERSFYTNTVIESARFFNRKVAEDAGGFDESVVFFEESTLPYKIKEMGFCVTARISAEILHHEDNFSLPKWLMKKYYYGKTALKYRGEYYAYSRVQMSFNYRLRIFLRSRRFYAMPLLAAGVLTLKFFESFSAGLGYVIGMIS